MAPVTRFLSPLLATASMASAAVLQLPIWFKNSYSVVEANIGTPSESHFLLFDSGSSTAWLLDNTCEAAGKCLNSSGYPRNGINPNASSTLASLDTYASIEYLSGTISGSGMSDQFSFPNSNSSISWDQSFLLVNESVLSWIPADGFMGLAFSTIADANTTTVVETLLQNGDLDEPRFGVYYGKEFNDTGNAAGEGFLTIGGSHEDTYVEGELAWTPLQKSGGDIYQLWRTNMKAIHGLTYDSNGTQTGKMDQFYYGDWAIFDTGAGGITVPSDIVEDLYRSIGMNYTAILNGDHKPLCTEFNSSWAVSFDFGEGTDFITVTLTGDQLARPGFGYREDWCNPPFGAEDIPGLFLFGSSFLQELYTVYDFGAFEVDQYNPRIGFGQLKDEWKGENK